MNKTRYIVMPLLMVFLLLVFAASSGAAVLIQCPGDLNEDGVPDPFEFDNRGDQDLGKPNPDYDPNVVCIHLSAGDGFAKMGDGRVQYIFSFADLTGIGDGTIAQPDGSIKILKGKNKKPDGDITDDVMEAGTLAAAWPAPVIAVDEGEEFYLTLTNVGMLIRPDLFDPHTVHFHGFPQTATVFDGLPESSLSINMGASLTYYYNLVEPGTYMYHCHVEATEHMQMGMLGNLYVRAGQNKLPDETQLGTHVHSNPDWNVIPGLDDSLVGDKYAYNDGDGSTYYDMDFPLQLGSFDPEFHDASWFVQPLPFAMMWDTYPMINGRGYPDTINPNPLPAPTENGGIESQVESSLITATAGDKVLLRLSNLNITATHTLASPSIPMRVVGIDAKELKSDDGNEKLHYITNSVTMGGGMSVDAILDTAGVPAGEYYLYASNLQYLANNDAPGLGGMMTKIVINP
jgi:FtsP/CotA-like multicopper oxidase with cupredoxin domain